MDANEKGRSGEKRLYDLLTKTFLGYWCYLNPKDNLNNQKEISDLLILFRDICIIIQVKNYEFKEDYDRYFKKTVDKAANQVSGAERKLFNSKEPVFLNHAKYGKVKFEESQFSKIVRIAVHFDDRIQMQHLGKLSGRNKRFVHFLLYSDFEIIISELFSIKDLIDFFDAREQFAIRINPLMFGREQDLLGFYLTIKSNFGYFLDNYESKRAIYDFDDAWIEYTKNKHPNDDLLSEVQWMIFDILNNNVEFDQENILIAESFLSLNKEEQRIYAVTCLNFIHEYLNKGNTKIIRRHIALSEYGFIFFYYPNSYSKNDAEKLGVIAAEGYADYVKYEIKMFIITFISEGEKISFTHLDLSNAEPIDPEILRNALDSLGWFNPKSITHMNVDIYKEENDQ